MNALFGSGLPGPALPISELLPAAWQILTSASTLASVRPFRLELYSGGASLRSRVGSTAAADRNCPVRPERR